MVALKKQDSNCCLAMSKASNSVDIVVSSIKNPKTRDRKSCNSFKARTQTGHKSLSPRHLACVQTLLILFKTGSLKTSLKRNQ